ncbi:MULTISPECIES: YhfZ family protein [Amycolatopsis methanolica group]|uniref:YhfZ family protein n=1 Tax=Amycolatopsis methanolica group TaxID=2893674 RepID=UPI00343DA9FF
MNDRIRPAASDRPLPRVLRAVVIDALQLGVGERLPTNAHYARTVGGTAGTIQRAMATLAEQGAVTTTSHGARGRAVESIDLGRAWALAGLPPVRLLLPPGGPEEVELLSEALTDDLTVAGIPHTVRHQRGGSRRLDSIADDRADVAVVSAGVLEAAARRLGDVHVRQLAPGTYYGRGRLVSVRRAAELAVVPQRVAIDWDSPDHVALTEASYPRAAGYTYVGHPFPDVPAAVLRGDVDAGVWHRSHTLIPLDLAGLACVPLPDRAEVVWSEISAAALVGSARRQELTSVFRAILTDPRWNPDTPTGK